MRQAFRNAVVHTLDPGFARATGFVVDDGRVVALDGVLPADATDLGGDHVIPAFIDSHVHILETGLRLSFCDLTGAVALEDVYERLLAVRRVGTAAGLVMAFNLEPDHLAERRLPTRRELDRVLPDIPLLVRRTDGHSASLNTPGLALALPGALPEGVEFDAYQEPTGIVRGSANERAVEGFERRLPAEVKIDAFGRCAELALSQGVTAFAAMAGTEAVGDETCELLAAHRDRLPVAVLPFCQVRDIARVRGLGLPRIGGCILVDGSFASHTAALRQPYADDPGNRGVRYFTDDELTGFLRAAHDAGLQTAVHAIGDAAVEQVVRGYESFLHGNELDHRIEHAELLDQGLIERIAALGLIVSVQPAFEQYWGGEGGMYHQRLGTRAQLTNPLARLLAAGVLVCAGSDSPITPLNPRLGIRAAVNHPTPAFRVSPGDALLLYTRSAARALHLPELGRLAKGCRADFLIIDRDPLESVDFTVLGFFRGGARIF